MTNCIDLNSGQSQGTRVRNCEGVTALGLRTEGREHAWYELGVYPTGKCVSTLGPWLMVLFWKVVGTFQM